MLLVDTCEQRGVGWTQLPMSTGQGRKKELKKRERNKKQKTFVFRHSLMNVHSVPSDSKIKGNTHTHERERVQSVIWRSSPLLLYGFIPFRSLHSFLYLTFFFCCIHPWIETHQFVDSISFGFYFFFVRMQGVYLSIRCSGFLHSFCLFELNWLWLYLPLFGYRENAGKGARKGCNSHVQDWLLILIFVFWVAETMEDQCGRSCTFFIDCDRRLCRVLSCKWMWV